MTERRAHEQKDDVQNCEKQYKTHDFDDDCCDELDHNPRHNGDRDGGCHHHDGSKVVHDILFLTKPLETYTRSSALFSCCATCCRTSEVRVSFEPVDFSFFTFRFSRPGLSRP